MNMQTYSRTTFALLAACRALAGEPANTWGPVTNDAQMAISVVSPGSLMLSKKFIVPGGTNKLGGATTLPVAAKSELKAGEPFSLLVRIRNLSTYKTVTFACWGACPGAKDGLACVVISPSGKDISPRVATNSSGPFFRAGSVEFVVAQPNETAEFEFPLSQLCKLDEIGTYRITAKKSSYAKAEEAFVLTSNTLSVSVVPDE
jgi:hypothetical protein